MGLADSILANEKVSAPALSPYLQEIANKVLADEQIMMALGSSCLIAARRKNMVKGSMMSEKYWGSYPNKLKEFVRYKGFAYLSFSEAKEIIKFIKKDIKKYAKLCEQEEAEKAAAETQGGEPAQLYEGLDELSPKLIQKAADKAWDMERYSQAEKFEDEAERRAGAEFGKDECIRRITPKSIAYVMADNSSGLICRDGSYTFRPRSGYNNESGNLRGRSKFPDYMKVHDKHAARTISRWWKMYHDEGIEIPFIDDWHNLVKW